MKASRVAAQLAAVLCAWAPPVFSQADPFDFDLTETENADASSWQFSGYLENRNQYFTADMDEDWLSNRLLGRGELTWRRDRWLAFAATNVEHDPATRDYRDPFRTQVQEAYLQWDGDRLDVSLGKQRVAWGTADGVSTIDRVNAVDLREPIGNARTASRRPSWLVRVQQSTSIGIVEAVWLPRGRDRKLPERDSPWEPADLAALRELAAAGVAILVTDDPEDDEYGLRYSRYGQGVDWGLAVFDGYTDAPVTLAEENNSVVLKPERITTWNANAAVGLANSTWRGEVAYTPDHVNGDEQTGRWQAVLGWDRTYFSNLYLNFQLFWEKVGGNEEDFGGTFAVTNKFFDDAATAGVRGQLGRDNQLSAEVYIDYAVNDAWTLTAKAFVFEGDTGSALADFTENDFVEFTLRWSF